MRSTRLRKLARLVGLATALVVGAAAPSRAIPTVLEAGGTDLGNPFLVVNLPSAATARGIGLVTDGNPTGTNDACQNGGGSTRALCLPIGGVWVQANGDALTLDGKEAADFLWRDGSLAMTGSLAMGGQTIFGNSTVGGSLTLISTSNATKGLIALGSGSDLVVDDATGRVGIGDPTPETILDVVGELSLTTGPLTLLGGADVDLSSAGEIFGILNGTGGVPSLRFATANSGLWRDSVNDAVGISTGGASRFEAWGTKLVARQPLELVDLDATPVADRRLRVIDGLVRATDTSNIEGAYISAASIQAGTLDAGTLDGLDSLAFLRRDGSTAMLAALPMGGFAIYGNSTASGSLALVSTSNATKGLIALGAGSDLVVDDTTGFVGIGDPTPETVLDVVGELTLTTGPLTLSGASIALSGTGSIGGIANGTAGVPSVSFATTTTGLWRDSVNDAVGISTSGISRFEAWGTKLVARQPVEFIDLDATPVADRRLRVIDGLLRATDTANAEGAYISGASIQAGTLDAGTLDSLDSTAFLRVNGSTPMTGALPMGGQTIFGNSTAAGGLTLISTSNATRGLIALGSGSDLVVDDATGRVGIGDPTPETTLDVVGELSLATGPLTITGGGDIDLSSAGEIFGILNGTGGVPSVRFGGANSGLWRDSTNDAIGISTGGISRLEAWGTKIVARQPLELVDLDATPVADRRLRVIDGFFRATDTSNIEGAYISGASIQAGTLDAGTLDGLDSTAFLRVNGSTPMLAALPMGGFAIYGNSTVGGSLTLISTSNATRGLITLGSGSDLVVDDATGRVGIGDPTPDTILDVVGELSLTTGPLTLAGGADIDLSSGGEIFGVVNGTSGVPSVRFAAVNSGFYRDSATDAVGISTAGTSRLEASGTRVLASVALELADLDATPTGNVQLRVVDQRIKATNTSGIEQRWISGNSVDLSGQTIGNADTLDSLDSTAFLRVNGSTPMLAALPMGGFSLTGLAIGSAAAPSLSFTADGTTGVYSPGTGQIAVSSSGTQKLLVTSSSVEPKAILDMGTYGARFATGAQTTPSISFSADTNTGLYDSAGFDEWNLTSNGTRDLSGNDTRIYAQNPLELQDQTAATNRRLRVEAGIVKATDTSNVEQLAISEGSVRGFRGVQVTNAAASGLGLEGTGTTTAAWTTVNARQIQGKAVSSTAPSVDGQLWQWNVTNNQWEPATSLAGAYTFLAANSLKLTPGAAAASIDAFGNAGICSGGTSGGIACTSGGTECVAGGGTCNLDRTRVYHGTGSTPYVFALGDATSDQALITRLRSATTGLEEAGDRFRLRLSGQMEWLNTSGFATDLTFGRYAPTTTAFKLRRSGTNTTTTADLVVFDGDTTGVPLDGYGVDLKVTLEPFAGGDTDVDAARVRVRWEDTAGTCTAGTIGASCDDAADCGVGGACDFDGLNDSSVTLAPFEQGVLIDYLKFDGQAQEIRAPRRITRTGRAFSANDATPSVHLGNFFRTANTVATTITTFDSLGMCSGVGQPLACCTGAGTGSASCGLVDGQDVEVKIVDAVTTVDFSANANMVGNGGIDWKPVSGDVLRCTYSTASTSWSCSVSTQTQICSFTLEDPQAGAPNTGDNGRLQCKVPMNARIERVSASIVDSGGGSSTAQLGILVRTEAADTSVASILGNTGTVACTAPLTGRCVTVTEGTTAAVAVFGGASNLDRYAISANNVITFGVGSENLAATAALRVFVQYTTHP